MAVALRHHHRGATEGRRTRRCGAASLGPRCVVRHGGRGVVLRIRGRGRGRRPGARHGPGILARARIIQSPARRLETTTFGPTRLRRRAARCPGPHRERNRGGLRCLRVGRRRIRGRIGAGWHHAGAEGRAQMGRRRGRTESSSRARTRTPASTVYPGRRVGSRPVTRSVRCTYSKKKTRWPRPCRPGRCSTKPGSSRWDPRDATRENSHHEHRILDEDDEPTPLTLFRDAIDEDNDEEEEDAGFASAGNDGANERVGPGQADDVALDVMPNNDDSLVNDDSFADPALDISVEDTGHDADGAGTPQRSARPPASSHVAMGALSPPSPLVAPSERHSFRLSRQASSLSQGSGSSQKSSSTPTRGWGEGGHSTPDTTRRMSKAEEVLKAATRHSSDDDVDELADSSDEEGAGPSMAPSSNLGTPQTLHSQRASIGSHGSFSPYGSEGDVPSPHGGGC